MKLTIRTTILYIIVFIFLFNLYSPVKSKSQTGLARTSQNMVLIDAPLTESYFKSTTTNNGFRRFNAIGNFLDTTDNKYFANSVSYLNFELPQNPQIIWESAVLTVYKYASSANTDTKVELQMIDFKNRSKNIGTALASKADYDFQQLRYDIDIKYLKNATGRFTLTIPNDKQNKGIAICSGKRLDVFCSSNFSPQLSVTYRINQLGSLISDNIDLFAGVYNNRINLEHIQCKLYHGCQLNILAEYKDIDQNSKLKFIIFKDEEITYTTEASLFVKDKLELTEQFDLADGEYKLRLYLQDGSVSDTLLKESSFQIDTTPPGKPEVVAKSNNAGRNGFRIALKQDINVNLYYMGICDYTLSVIECNPDTNIYHSRYSHNQLLEFDSGLVLSENKKYKYYIYAEDLAGNQSEQYEFELLQKNQLGKLAINTLKQDIKLSPKNNDHHFDNLMLEFESSKILKKLELNIVSLQTSELMSIQIDKDLNLKNIELTGNDLFNLPEGDFFVYASAIDHEGYPLFESNYIRFTIDNKAPNIWLKT